MNDRRVRAAKIGVIALGFALLPAFATSGFRLRLFTLVVVFALFTIALNVVFGHTDQLFLFVGGLAGISGYTAVIGANALGVTPWLTLPLGVLAAGIVGAGVSYVAAKRRFSVILIAIFTLALQLALHQFFVGAGSITGGSNGILLDGLLIDDRMVFYYLFVVVLLGFLVGYDRLVHSRFGLAFDSIRADELAAESTGVDVVRYKVYAGLFAALMIGLVGSLYGFSEGYISPASYSFHNIDVLILIMLTLGGMRTVLGPIVGAIVIFWVNELLVGTQGWRTFVFGVLLIVLFLYFREGIVPKVEEFLDDRDLDLASVVERAT